MYKPAGSLVGLPTPFDHNEQIDFGAFQALVDYHVENGSDALFVMASTGEPTLMTFEERCEIVKRLVKMCKGRIPAFFGATLPTTELTVKFTKFAEAEGADGLIFSAPAYIMPSQIALYEFVKTAMQSVSIPVGLYHNKPRTGVMLTAANLERLSKECPNFCVLKESSNDNQHIEETCFRIGKQVNILAVEPPQTGNILLIMTLGGKGLSGSASNVIPREIVEICKPWTTMEQMEKSKAVYFENYKLLTMLNNYTNPVAVKAAMNLMGLPGGYLRKPNLSLDGPDLEALKAVLEEYHLVGKYK